jgi:quinone-modifying oxidoreductase subunit QmoB
MLYQMGMIRVEKVKLPEPYKTNPFLKNSGLGGGVTGMSAALDASKPDTM